MKLNVNKQDLQKAVNTVSRAALSKPQRSILECILFEASNNRIILNAFDSVTAIETSSPADVFEEGVCAVPARLVSDVISKLPEGDVIIEKTDSTGVTISCQSTCIKLSEMDEMQFPRFPEVKGDSFTIGKELLKDVIDKTVFAAYPTPDKPIFTGLLFEISEAALNVVALDGARLAKKSVEISGAKPARIVVPGKSVKEVSRLVSDTECENVEIMYADKACFFVTPDFRIYTRLLDGEFLNYNNIIPPDFKTRIRIDSKQLEASLNMVSVLSRDQSANPVKLTVGLDSLKISSTSEFGNAEDVIPAILEGETMSIFVNARYMIEALRYIESEDVFINFENPLKPCIIKPVAGEEYLQLVVPLNMR